ncbi:MAG TPA: pyruvate kinase alpha/beta domain-containing protein [Patescibacteria group bacterium]|nr:pyruvate kinase alpha/beta domain-containing protein [Patescibacteria group bacterium]
MSLEKKTIYFEKGGKEHTVKTLEIALEAAKDRSINTVLVSSTTGFTALEAIKVFEDSGLKLIIVTHQTGYRDTGVQLMPQETREKLEAVGAKVYTGTDVLTGGIDVGVSRQRPPRGEPQEARIPNIVPPVSTLVANVLRMFSQGVKVCVEIAMMASDGGILPPNEKVVCVAGSHAGADTVMVLTPSTSNLFRNMKFHEIVCKPL